jgi:iron complex transport system ATP-binding protein
MSATLHMRDVFVAVGGRTLLEAISLDVKPGQLMAIVGPNGAGKSTLLKTLSGDITPKSGSVLLNGRPLPTWRHEELARQRAVLPQTSEPAFGFRAWDTVALGRHPHRHRARRDEDDAAIVAAMHTTDTSAFAARDCATLSGGELQRIHLARVLAQIAGSSEAQGPRFLLLDEPTSSLDLYHQHAILTKARAIGRSGIGVVVVLHDLNLAAAYADEMVVLSRGRTDGIGPPEQVLTAERIGRVWQVPCCVDRIKDGTIRVTVSCQARPDGDSARQAAP